MSETIPAPQAGPRRRRTLVFAASLALAAALLAWTLQRAGPAGVASALQGASAGWVCVVIALVCVRTVVAAWRLYAVTRPLSPGPFHIFASLVLGSQFVGLLLPGPRVAPVVWRAHSAGRRLGGGTALHMAPNIADQLLLASACVIVALAAAPFLASPGRPVVGLALLPAAAVPLAAGSAFLLLRARAASFALALARPRAGWRGRVARRLAPPFEGFAALLARPSAVVHSIGGGLAFVALTALAQHAALHAVGAPVSIWVSLLAVIAGGAAGLIGLTPAGVGATEAAALAVLTSHGVAAGPAGGAVVLATGCAYALSLAGGGIAFVRESWASRA